MTVQIIKKKQQQKLYKKVVPSIDII